MIKRIISIYGYPITGILQDHQAKPVNIRQAQAMPEPNLDALLSKIYY